jgi:leucine dehydrogenase
MDLALEKSLVLEEIIVPGYERVIKITEGRVGLQAIVCIHNTLLGPALGGTRIYPYATFQDALTDVKRLSKGMTYKSALAETGLGGGKSVIIADPNKEKTEEMLLSFGQAIHRLKGAYITAEDVGCSPKDASVMSRSTPYIVGLPHEKSSGDPGPFTAWGVFRGIQSALKKIYGDDDVRGRTIAVQGLGSVGGNLVKLLFWAGAKLIISDIDEDKTKRLAQHYGAEISSPDEILKVECDLFSPCAMGGILNSQTIPHLRCLAVAGAANNQLLNDTDAEMLKEREILYAPDFVINAGGLINVTEELQPTGYHPSLARDKIHKIYDQLLLIYGIAEQSKISPQAAAIALGDYRLKYRIGKRTTPLYFHHAGYSL